MNVFSDQFGRKIWFTVSDNFLNIDLQDLNNGSEHEQSATVNGISELCKILNCDPSSLESELHKRFGGQVNSFDLLTDFLTENNIQYGYYSGGR